MSFALPEVDVRDPELEDGPLARALERLQRNFDALRTGFPIMQEHLVSLPHAKIWRQTPAAYSGAAWAPVTFDQMAEDERGLFGAAGFTLTMPSDGLYLCAAAVAHLTHGGTNSSARMRINGVDLQVSGGAPTAVGSNTPLCYPERLSKGDVLTLEVFQNSGAGINYGGSESELSLSVVRLGN